MPRRHHLGLAAPWVLAALLAVGPRAAANAEASGAGSPGDSVSAGLPWAGQLQHGVRLRASEVVRHLPKYGSSDNFYGTRELVSMLERVAAAVARRWPGSRLTVGELSARRGGQIEGHHSHRSGRDADVAFYMRDGRGAMERFRRFVSFDRDGLARNAPSRLRFDDARNWAAVAHMLRDPEARVQYVFVSRAIRTRLLMAGRRHGESTDFLRAAAAVMVEPKHGHSHHDHFHVRIFCAQGDRPACEDQAPYWPWYEGAPPGGRHAELPTIHWRTPTVAAVQASAMGASARPLPGS